MTGWASDAAGAVGREESGYAFAVVAAAMMTIAILMTEFDSLLVLSKATWGMIETVWFLVRYAGRTPFTCILITLMKRR